MSLDCPYCAEFKINGDDFNPENETHFSMLCGKWNCFHPPMGVRAMTQAEELEWPKDKNGEFILRCPGCEDHDISAVFELTGYGYSRGESTAADLKDPSSLYVCDQEVEDTNFSHWECNHCQSQYHGLKDGMLPKSIEVSNV